jgi:hypothetical protein
MQQRFLAGRIRRLWTPVARSWSSAESPVPQPVPVCGCCSLAMPPLSSLHISPDALAVLQILLAVVVAQEFFLTQYLAVE